MQEESSRANYEVEKQIRTLRSRFEENYGESVGLDHKMLPFPVRHCAWLITKYQVKSDGKTPYKRVRGRPYQGQVAEFAEVVHFRDPREGCRHAQVGRQMEPRLVAGKEPGVRRALRWNIGRSSPVSIHLETPRETTLGQEDVD